MQSLQKWNHYKVKIDTKKYLESCGIKASVQRIAIMDYLLSHKTHPTVDEIYTSLAEDYPTLSRTTVYNTLNLFSQYGAVLTLNLSGTTAHYDGDTSTHGHFLCTHCNKIFDLEIEDTSFIEKNKPEGFEIEDVQLYYKGICINCLKNKEL